ncbi:MAG TPA: UbiH/UbiF/VisC/COQ6 family ubiquinone biosynthesis hydroxylase [Chakrabartia sp.]|nr:UbiH/UbiF/VisC/COQ6 family ubiquinone biosynthesis hydroxylase [Chakrabartia sp.]
MERYDVIILGGGLVGLTLALALEQGGLHVAVVDPQPNTVSLDERFDGRASAIASASWRMFEQLGFAEMLEPHACAIRRIEVRDGPSPEALDFTVGSEEEPLGFMLENRQLRVALAKASADKPGIRQFVPDRAVETVRDEHGVRVTLASGAVLEGALLVAAEGRQSPTREANGFKLAKWDYRHIAIISAFDHERDHGNVAHEIFYPAGPFALLPLNPGTRSALVWSVSPETAKGVLALSDRAFLAEAQKRAGSLLGTLGNIAPRSSYPLTFLHTAKMVADRLALIGDAAHGMHPIAGQGLNLGLRDVAALAEVLVDGARTGMDMGDAQLLKRYETWRSFDALTVMAATDSINRLFGVEGKTARSVRRFGLAAVQRFSPLKSFFMAEARGQGGDMPRLLQGRGL